MQVKSISNITHAPDMPDVLERVLDKGVVIAGDIKIRLVDVELLSLQIRLVICSVDKAREMGMDWWVNDSALNSRGHTDALGRIEERLTRLEAALSPESAPESQ